MVILAIVLFFGSVWLLFKMGENLHKENKYKAFKCLVFAVLSLFVAFLVV